MCPGVCMSFIHYRSTRTHSLAINHWFYYFILQRVHTLSIIIIIDKYWLMHYDFSNGIVHLSWSTAKLRILIPYICTIYRSDRSLGRMWRGGQGIPPIKHQRTPGEIRGKGNFKILFLLLTQIFKLYKHFYQSLINKNSVYILLLCFIEKFVFLFYIFSI